MTRIAAVAVVLGLSLAPVPFVHAQSGGTSTQVKTYKAVGTVKKIDAAAGRVTLAHEAIPSLKWPAMTMGFGVKDKALFGKLAPEKKIEFEFVQQGRDYIVTSVK
jgi:Cu(I)/Ag(I) efflux system protein CusF